MPKISKYLKVDKNVLLEYVYDSENNLSEAYDVLVNTRDRRQSYLATSTSGTNNTQGNSLFKLDTLSNSYGKINPSFYSFLSVRNYSTSTPIRHDTLRVHLPINWTFGEYLGFYVRIFAYDTLNQQTYDLSNFYFDMTDSGQTYLLNFTSPPLLFQEKLWGKNIQIEIPALSELAAQRIGTRPKENSVNSNLTNGNGLSSTIPIFIDFHFINNIQTVNGISTYILSPKVSVSLPQTPEYEDLGLMIENSPNGDFFEIYGTYNGTIAGFDQFIEDSYYQGHRYYVQYSITMYEQNIRGKTITAVVTENFTETIEFRPIIKFSTTTAIIDVEMRLIDAVDETYIIRRASYGMLQDEVSRYSLNLIKINLKNANKPKIYNIKNSIDPSLVGVANSMGSIKLTDNKRIVIPPTSKGIKTSADVLNNDPNNPFVQSTVGPGGITLNNNDNLMSNINNDNNPDFQQVSNSQSGIQIETVKVPYPVLVERLNVMSRSDSAVLNSTKYYANGLITIMLNPFDNIFKFSIATGSPDAPKLFDLSAFNEIKFVIKNDKGEVSFPLFTQSGDINLKNGNVVFNVTQNRFQEIKKIYNEGVNIFYIIGRSGGSTYVIYSGLFKIFDSPESIAQLNQVASKANTDTGGSGNSIDSQMSASGLGSPAANAAATAAGASPAGTNNTTQPQVILDPSINSSVKDLVKKPITTESLPQKKPDLAKTIQEKIKQTQGLSVANFKKSKDS
jgi:hypothetical protein